MSALLRSEGCFFDACCDAAWTPCHGAESDALRENEPCDYPASPARFMSGKIELEAVEAASRVAIHAFFRDYSATKTPWEVDALIARYDARGVGPRQLLFLVENAFNRGRARKRRLLALRDAATAVAAAPRPEERLYLTNGDDRPAATAAAAATDRRPAATLTFRGLLWGGQSPRSPRSPPPPPGPDVSPAGSPLTPRYVSPLTSPARSDPPPSPAAAAKRSSVRVGRTTVTLSPDEARRPAVSAAAAEGTARAGKKKKKKKKKGPPRAPPGTAYHLD